MKSIFLIGDSIRFGAYGCEPQSPGYGHYVKEYLAGRANVFAPDENCRFAQYTLRYAHEWAAKVDAQSIDVVHWNNGLWDVLQLFGDEPFTQLEFYLSTLRRIHSRLRQCFPNAKIIFATSTPVVERIANPDFFRSNRVIEQYNDAAKALMRELNVPVDDLYAVAARFDERLHSDWVHYNEDGSRLLAQAVIRSIEENAL